MQQSVRIRRRPAASRTIQGRRARLAAAVLAVAAVLAGALYLVLPREGRDLGAFAAPIVVQSCYGRGAGARLTVVCPAAPSAGDVLLAGMCTAGGEPVAAPAGFTPAGAHVAGAPQMFYRVAAGGDAARMTFALPEKVRGIVQIVEWRGVEPARPLLFAAGSAAAGSTATTPALPPIVAAPTLPTLHVCAGGAVSPRFPAGWKADGARSDGVDTIASAHALALSDQPAGLKAAVALRTAAGGGIVVAFLNPSGSARAYAAPVAPPHERNHVNLVTYGCVDGTVPCGGATPVPASWWAEHATMMSSNRSDMAAFKRAGGKHLLFYTDPNKIVPSHKEPFWNAPEAAFCHSSLPAQTITVRTNVRKGVQYVEYSGEFTPAAGNTAVADTTGDPDDIKFISVDAGAHTFNADFGKAHRAPFTVALNRLYNTQNNPRGENAAENRSAYGNDNLLVPSRSNGFREAYTAVLREFSSIPGADYVEVDDVYGDYPSVLYNFYTESGKSARGGSCAEAPSRAAYNAAVILEFLTVVANGFQPIDNGASNMDTTQNNDPPGPSENIVFHPYVVGDQNNEGCIVGTPMYKGEKLWLADQTQSLTATTRHKINICWAQTPGATEEALRAARLFFFASNMLVYDPAFSYVFENLAGGRAHIFIFPEEQIVPSSPVETAARVDVRTLKYGYPRLKRGVYFRQFVDCWEDGRRIGACAFFVNPTGGALTMPPQSALAAKYSWSATVNTPNLYEGGAVRWEPWTLPESLPAQSALIVKH